MLVAGSEHCLGVVAETLLSLALVQLELVVLLGQMVGLLLCGVLSIGLVQLELVLVGS